VNICFHKFAWQDYLFWLKEDKRKLRRINALIKDIQRNPFEGLGKVEALKFDLQGAYSRRIDTEHRLVYRVEENMLIIISCRYHY
jgi:toxin YoeB